VRFRKQKLDHPGLASATADARGGPELESINIVVVMEQIKALRGRVPKRIQVDNVLRQRIHLEGFGQPCNAGVLAARKNQRTIRSSIIQRQLSR
jgi:hypothetical protein